LSEIFINHDIFVTYMVRLEEQIEKKVKPILEKAMHESLGITVDEIKSDISDELKQNPVLDLLIDYSKPYKEAKEDFKRQYVMKLLIKFFGNVSEVAKLSGLERRTIHRLIKKFNISAIKIRKAMAKMDYIKESAVSDIIEETLDHYKAIINPEKLKSMYEKADKISKEIVQELPEEVVGWKEAEEDFDRRFLAHILHEEKSTTKAARRIKIRYETLHRKLKKLGISG